MIADRSTATAWVRDVAVGQWDGPLADRGGFTRTATAVTYTRKVADGGRQRIHLDLFVRPPYAPDAFHLSPRCSVAFAEMATIGANLLGSRAAGFGKSGIVDVGLLDLIAPKSPMFLFASPEELSAFGPEILDLLVDALVPYLDQRTSVAALTAAKRREWVESGAAPGDVGRFPVIVAAGQLALGEAQEALRTLETAYPEGTPGGDMFGHAVAVARKAAAAPG